MTALSTIDATLTQAERAAPFALGSPDFEPLPKATRLQLEWEESRFAEIDPVTGTVVAVGEVLGA